LHALPRKRAGLVASLRGRFEALKAEHSSAARLGVAVGVGVFCGLSPLIGFQFLLALGLAFLLRLNKLAVMLGLQISAPPITPLVVLAEIQLGELLLRGRLLPLSLARIKAMSGHELLATFLVDLTVGGLTSGVIAGGALGAIAASLIQRRRRGAPRSAPTE
jgi:uncharacterized protein (DUF2062 family)